MILFKGITFFGEAGKKLHEEFVEIYKKHFGKINDKDK